MKNNTSERMYYMYKRLILLSLTFCIFLTGCTSQKDKTAAITSQSTSTSKNSNEDLVNKIESLQNQLVEKNKTIQELTDKSKEFEVFKSNTWEELDYYLQFIDKTTKYLNEDELLSLAKGEWKYTIKADEIPVPSSGLLTIDKSNFKIVISEEEAPYPALSKALHTKGKLSGKPFTEQIKFLNYKPSKVIDMPALSTNLSTQYDFRGIPKGTTINIEFTKELQERLNLEKNIIIISVK